MKSFKNKIEIKENGKKEKERSGEINSLYKLKYERLDYVEAYK